jgi:hypothetical protein
MKLAIHFSIAIAIITIVNSAFAQKSPLGVSPVVQSTADQDHKKMMQLLNITSVRPGPSGNPQAPNAANSDESKATTYTSLPDPLISKAGEKISSSKQWRKRRAEIMEDFDREVYGRVPKNVPKVKWKTVSTNNDSVGGFPVIVKKLVGHVDNSSFPYTTVDIDLTLTTPANTNKPVPVMMEFGFVFPPGFRPPVNPNQPVIEYKPWQEQLLAKGWGYAILIPTSVQADNGSCLTEGIIGLINKGQPRKADDWGALRAWAWGASRALDYFETDKSVDAKKLSSKDFHAMGKPQQ